MFKQMPPNSLVTNSPVAKVLDWVGGKLVDQANLLPQ